MKRSFTAVIAIHDKAMHVEKVSRHLRAASRPEYKSSSSDWPKDTLKEGARWPKKESGEKGQVYLRKIRFSQRNRRRMQISAQGTIINGEQRRSWPGRKKF